MTPYSLNWLNRLVSQTLQEEGLDAIAAELIPSLRDFLRVDRVMLARFESDDRLRTVEQSEGDRVRMSLLKPLSSAVFQAEQFSFHTRQGWRAFGHCLITDAQLQNMVQMPWLPSDAPSATRSYQPISAQQRAILTELSTQFLLALPIFAEESIFGLILAHNKVPISLSDTKIALLKAATDQLSIALKQQSSQPHHQASSHSAQQRTGPSTGPSTDSSTGLIESEPQQDRAVLERLKHHQRTAIYCLDKLTSDSIELSAILPEISKALCHSLSAERVLLYQFDEFWGGSFRDDWGYVVSEWQHLPETEQDPLEQNDSEQNEPKQNELEKDEPEQNTAWNDAYLQDTQGGCYRHNEVCIVNDMDSATLPDGHLKILEKFSLRAYMAAPVFARGQLWGLLVVHQYSRARAWQPAEVYLLQQIAIAVGLSLEKANWLVQQSAGDTETLATTPT